jgi:hypothetical protein
MQRAHWHKWDPPAVQLLQSSFVPQLGVNEASLAPRCNAAAAALLFTSDSPTMDCLRARRRAAREPRHRARREFWQLLLTCVPYCRHCTCPHPPANTLLQQHIHVSQLTCAN